MPPAPEGLIQILTSPGHEAGAKLDLALFNYDGDTIHLRHSSHTLHVYVLNPIQVLLHTTYSKRVLGANIIPRQEEHPKMGTGKLCIKYLLFSFNVVFWVSNYSLFS